MRKLIWYFAYGSNMKESRLRNRNVSFSTYRTGYLDGYTFRYNKIGADNTGKGNIISQENNKVWGVFFKIPEKDYIYLHQNFEIGYNQVEIEGISNQAVIRAKSFSAKPEIIDDSMVPSKRYHHIVLAGAREKGLPEKYVLSLEQKGRND